MSHDPRMENLALFSCKYPFIFLHYFPSLFITAMVLLVSGNTNVFYDLRLGILVCLMFALIVLGFNLMFLSAWRVLFMYAWVRREYTLSLEFSLSV